MELLPPGANGARSRPTAPPASKGSPAPVIKQVSAQIDVSQINSAQFGVVEFFNDPMLTELINQGLGNNRELLTLNEEVEIARNEILARRGAYLPFVTYGTRVGVNKSSFFTPAGALEDQIQYSPGKNFPDPVPEYLGALNIFWRLDIWREFRNAQAAASQRFIAANERRNYFVTEMVADIADDYYELMALDKRLENLDQTIKLQEHSREIAKAIKEAGRDTELPVQRFQAEVSKNQSEKLIVLQEIVESENRINFQLNRFPQPVARNSSRYYDLKFQRLSAGVPSQLLQNRPDIRQAERELAAAGLDVQVARAHFFPSIDIVAGVGYAAFDPKYLFNTPESLIYNVAGDLVGPLINKKAIQAEYMTANAKQLQAVYNYQRTVLNAYTEVVNRISKVEKFGRSIEIKKQQLAALDASVRSADNLFQNARAEYLEVLLAQRDLRDARMVLIDTKREQLGAIVSAYQALGGGVMLSASPVR
jgi:NodT family efflux transporter outer membrane factor (OMF) lipoprotein